MCWSSGPYIKPSPPTNTQRGKSWLLRVGNMSLSADKNPWLFPGTKASEGNGTNFQVPCVLFNLIITIIHWIDRITLHHVPEEVQKHQNTCLLLHRQRVETSSIQPWSGPWLPNSTCLAGLRACLFEDIHEEDMSMQSFITESLVPFALHMIMFPLMSVSQERGCSEQC